jgi:hypothetical protein
MSAHREPLHELLADRALVGLSPAAERRLAVHPADDRRDDSYELAAAAAYLALRSAPERLPDDLRSRVERSALEMLDRTPE